MRYSRCGDTVAREGFLQMRWAGKICAWQHYRLMQWSLALRRYRLRYAMDHGTASLDSPVSRAVIAHLTVYHALSETPS